MSGDYIIFDPSSGERTGSIPPPSRRWAGPTEGLVAAGRFRF